MSKPKIEREILVPDSIIKELLTESEWRMVKQRLHIIHLLGEKKSIRAIAEEAEVGTDTVVRIARRVESNPILQKLANRMSQSSSSKWVFGKAEE